MVNMLQNHSIQPGSKSAGLKTNAEAAITDWRCILLMTTGPHSQNGLCLGV